MTLDNASTQQIAMQVTAAYERFYTSVIECDFDALAAGWERSERATCVHKDGQSLQGWDQIGPSWQRFLAIESVKTLTFGNASVVVLPDVAWVLSDMDFIFLDKVYPLTATEIFVRHGQEWLMVSHHASAVRNVSHTDIGLEVIG